MVKSLEPVTLLGSLPGTLQTLNTHDTSCLQHHSHCSTAVYVVWCAAWTRCIHNQGWGAEVMDEDSFHDEDGGQGPGTPEGAGGKVRGVNGVATKKISLSSACWSPWLALSSVCGVVKIREALGLGLARPGHRPPLTLSSSSSHLASPPDQRLDKQCAQHTTFSCLLPLFTDQSDSRLLILDTG